MSQTSEIHNTRAESFRVPIDCAVDLRLDDSEEWTRRTATNISMSGMFIRTPEAYPQGTELGVKFELYNGQPAIRGRAEVLWCRARKAGPERPRGVGVCFLDLDLESKYAISRLVDRYRQLVKMPFQRPVSEVDPAATPHSRSRWNALALAFVTGLAAGILGSFWLIGSGRTEPPGTGTVRASELAPAAAQTVAPTPVPPAGKPGEDPLQTPPFREGKAEVAAVEKTIDEWAAAWATKNVERYLGCYAVDFEPADGMTVDDWQAQRRARLARSGEVEVILSALEVELTGPGRATARFDQTYARPGYRDRVRKSLQLRRRQGEWLIQREEIVRELPADAGEIP